MSGSSTIYHSPGVLAATLTTLAFLPSASAAVFFDLDAASPSPGGTDTNALSYGGTAFSSSAMDRVMRSRSPVS